MRGVLSSAFFHLLTILSVIRKGNHAICQHSLVAPCTLRSYMGVISKGDDTNGLRGVYCAIDGVQVGYVSQFAFPPRRFSKDEHGNPIQTSHNDWYGNVIPVLKGKFFVTWLKFIFAVVCKGGYVS